MPRGVTVILNRTFEARMPWYFEKIHMRSPQVPCFALATVASRFSAVGRSADRQFDVGKARPPPPPRLLHAPKKRAGGKDRVARFCTGRNNKAPTVL